MLEDVLCTSPQFERRSCAAQRLLDAIAVFHTGLQPSIHLLRERRVFGYPIVNVCEYTIDAGATSARFLCPFSPTE